MNSVCIFEDQEVKQLFPLTRTRPAFDLCLGTGTLFDRFFRYFNFASISLHCRDYLKASVKERHRDFTVNNINLGTPTLFINSRLFMTDELFQRFMQLDLKKSALFTYKGHVVAAYLRDNLLTAFRASLNSGASSIELIKAVRTQVICKELDHAYLICKLWDMIRFIPDTITFDFDLYNQRGIIKGNLKPFVSIYNEDNVFIDQGSVIEDFVVINAENGPVYIDKGVTIQANSRIEGPVYIGKGSQILGATIKSASINAYCKVGGELSNSILFSYSNKAHEGYIGHSVIGEWVNLGALTTTSNLKNNYSTVSLSIKGDKIDTQQQFLGSIIGDFTKTGIATMLNTGTLVGLGSTLFESGFHAKWIPDFSWGTPHHYSVHVADKFLSTVKKMHDRRSVTLSDNQRQLLMYLHKMLATTGG